LRSSDTGSRSERKRDSRGQQFVHDVS